MAMFVHLAPESRVGKIRRTGIGRPRRSTKERPGGIYAVPVTRHFFVSHQWLRELKRKGQGLIVGVYFRIPDDDDVWVGHYSREHQRMTAAEAVAEFLSEEVREGWEVIIPRRIEAAEIHRVRTLPQIVGWRYYPAAKGKIPCPCKFCSRGDYGARRLRKRLGWKDD